MSPHEYIQQGDPCYDLMWEHLRRVFPETDLNDTSDSGESWEYMGTWFGPHANYDNTGLPINVAAIGPCWSHQFRHRDYRDLGLMYVNIVADFESIPGVKDSMVASDQNAAMACALNNGDGEDFDSLPF